MNPTWLTHLRETGVVVTTAETLLGPALWQELATAVETTVREARPSIETRQTEAAAGVAPTPLVIKGYPYPNKLFLTQLLGARPRYEASSIWARVAQAPQVVEIATAYLPAPPVLKAYNVWVTRSCGRAPSDSQLWHRDVDDTRILKLFIYTTDVTLESGPFTYIPRTQGPMPRRRLMPACFIDYVRLPRTTDAMMAKCCPADQWQTLIGPAGLAVLVDTTCWHKGGDGPLERQCYLAMYTTYRNPARMAFTQDEPKSWP